MTLTIEDLLKSLESLNDKEEDKYSIREIWDMIIKGKSYEEMGFDSKKEQNTWMDENPYDNL